MRVGRLLLATATATAIRNCCVKNIFVIKAETRNDCFLCSFYARWFTQMNHSFTHSFTRSPRCEWVSVPQRPENANCARCSFGFVWIENQTKITWICFYISFIIIMFSEFPPFTTHFWDGRTNNNQQQKWLKMNLDWCLAWPLCIAHLYARCSCVYVCVCWPFFCFYGFTICRQSMTNLDVERLVSFNNFRIRSIESRRKWQVVKNTAHSPRADAKQLKHFIHGN